MKVEVYSREGCMYCTRAKDLLKSRNISYQEFSLGANGITKETIQERLTGMGIDKKVATIPQIFIEDEYIGGYVELTEWMLANKL